MTAVLVLAGLIIGFVLGVVFHKTVLDREERIKAHISAEISRSRSGFLELEAQLTHEANQIRERIEKLIHGQAG